jgi:hypothetical protein
MKRKVWNDRGYAEQYDFAGQQVLRFRTRLADPFTHYIGRFTKDHCRFASAQDRPMTQDEIQAFKSAKLVK